MNIAKAGNFLEQKRQQVQEGAEGLVGDGKEFLNEQGAKISEAQNTLVQMKNDTQTQIQQTTAQAKQNFDNYKERNAMMLANSENGGIDEGLKGLKEMGNNAINKAEELKDQVNISTAQAQQAYQQTYDENVNKYSQDNSENNNVGYTGAGRRRRRKRRKSKRWPRKKSKSKKSRKRRKKKGGRKSRKKKKRRSRKKSRRRRRR